ncbi:hypothetical protein B296_00029060 [Ensete ventricosum]|uniref:Uncharacterized protein n=1 Tax=Ensete ventricosum TaxID=4639 RepID=A0A426ZXP2_ENSVE|nr:hypothetical protein B296_00029060 [Ensete ventricosum]
MASWQATAIPLLREGTGVGVIKVWGGGRSRIDVVFSPSQRRRLESSSALSFLVALYDLRGPLKKGGE